MLLLLWMGGVPAVSSKVVAEVPDLRKLDRTPFFGQPHLRLRQWADSMGAGLGWQPGSRDVVVTNASHRIDFTVNSRRAAIDGIEVWLSYPLQLWHDTLLITEADLRFTLHPILFPRRNPPSKKLISIVLDPGHGGKDPGYESGPHKEKQYTLLLALELKRLLSNSGFKVVTTRQTDHWVDRPERAALASRIGADLFVSLHFNAAPSARGSEVYCLPPEGAPGNGPSGTIAPRRWPGNRHDARNALLAYQIQASLVRRFAMADRGVRRERFQVLREATVPAVLVEAAFLSDPDDARRIVQTSERRRMAQAIADGILAYKRLVDSPPVTKPKATNAPARKGPPS